MNIRTVRRDSVGWIRATQIQLGQPENRSGKGNIRQAATYLSSKASSLTKVDFQSPGGTPPEFLGYLLGARVPWPFWQSLGFT